MAAHREVGCRKRKGVWEWLPRAKRQLDIGTSERVLCMTCMCCSKPRAASCAVPRLRAKSGRANRVQRAWGAMVAAAERLPAGREDQECTQACI